MNRPLHILHTESSCGWGGQEIRILEEARGMMARGHKVTIACPATSQLYLRAPDWSVPVVALPIARKRLPALLALQRFLRRAPQRPDVINTHSSTDSWLTALALRTARLRIPVVRTRHISAPVKSSAANRWLYGRAASFVVTTGEKLRDELIAGLNVAPEAIASIPTGIDTQRYRPGDRFMERAALGLPEAGLWVGIIATLRSWKGHRYLLEALHQLDDLDLKLVVVGDGPQREALVERTRQLGLADRVHFAGNRADVAPWLRALDIFALPSYANEGVSQAVMQAMATGLPIITTAVGSMTDVIRDGDTGLIVPPQNPQALAASIRELASNAGLANRLGTNARSFAVEHCGLDHMVSRMEAVFRQALVRA